MDLNRLVIATIITGCLALPVPVSAEATTEKSYGEIEPDKALLYVIRPKGARGGNTVGQDIFADTKLLMRLRGNAYGFAYLEPGTHTIWGSGCYRDLELVPGKALYLLCGDLGMATVSEEEGLAYLEEVEYYNPPDPAVEAKRAGKEEKAESRLPKLRLSWQEYAKSIELESPAAPTAPSDHAGLVLVPAYSSIELELMENVSSFMSELGEEIWFRTIEETRANGSAWLPAGTAVKGIVVEIHHARRGGGSGGFEIEVPSLETPDGTAVPLIGQLIDAGRHKLGKASTAAAFGGLLGAAMVKGREAFELSGETWTAWTRFDIWVRPFASDSITAAASTSTTADPVDVRVEGALTFNLEKHHDPSEITLLVETDALVSHLEATAVNDWPLPEPVETLRLESRDSVMAATFDGWSLLRYLPPGPEPVPVRFSGRLADGTEFTALADLSWLESSAE